MADSQNDKIDLALAKELVARAREKKLVEQRCLEAIERSDMDDTDYQTISDDELKKLAVDVIASVEKFVAVGDAFAHHLIVISEDSVFDGPDLKREEKSV